MLWEKHSPKFNQEMRNIELAKYNIYLNHGIDTFKLD